jgi:diguanylate cyclase (GGDEF)-like protein/PAS domain S-box-containing protein
VFFERRLVVDENVLRAARASMYEEIPDAVVLWDLEGRLISANAATELLSGYARSEMNGTRITDYVLRSDVERIVLAVRSIAAGRVESFSAHMRHRDGRTVPIECKAFPARAPDGTIAGVFTRLRDVVELREAEAQVTLNQRAIEVQSERIRRLFLTAASRGESDEQQIDNVLRLGLELFGFDCAYISRFDGERVVIRNVAGEARGSLFPGAIFRAETALSRHVRENATLSIPDFDAPEWKDESANAHGVWRAFFAARLVVGKGPYGALIFASRNPRSAVSDARDSDLIGLMALLVASVIDRIAADERIRELAFTDALTGLPNRVLWADRTALAVATAKRYGQGFALMYIDIDLFKSVNDAFGHHVGDEFLRAAAARLRSTLRESDTLARFGGDEFVILQTMVNKYSDASDLARKVTAAMQQPIHAAGHEFTIRASIGIALYPDDAKDVDTLMQLADEALYRAKAKGRNRWCFANEGREDAAREAGAVPSLPEAAG